MDPGALCDFCDSINFGVAGFYPSGLDANVLSNVDHERSLNEVLRSSKQCYFCGLVAELFEDWRSRRFGNHTLDLEKASVGVSELPIRSLEVPDEGERDACLVRIGVAVSVENPSSLGSYIGPSMQFQKCSLSCPEVKDFVNAESLFDWESGQWEAYSGRMRSPEADIGLFRKWRESCCSTHGNSCNLVFTGKRLPRLRLIDVENRCVVDSEDDSSYVALSYVWGEAKFRRLNKSTDEEFRRNGSLNRETLLSTIDDAIELTRRLGEKYIWVDCLCILQDDEADKLEFLPQMDSIYGFASLTIVAASGVDAHAGLPGLRGGSRTRKQKPFTIKGVSLLATLDQGGDGNECSYLGESAWSRRGWTFQEKLFSRRALIFTPEQVYWECQRASWCEDGLWETMKSPTIYRHCFDDADFRQPWGADVGEFERTYRKLVDEYSARELTYPSDGLDAFAGIIHHFKRQAGQDFLWGLPTSLFSNALTWPCDPAVKRRRELCTLRSKDGTSAPCPFPSWSWVGWVGETHYTQVFDRLDKAETLDLIFYRLLGNELTRIVEADLAAHNKEGEVSTSLVRKEGPSRTNLVSYFIDRFDLTSVVQAELAHYNKEGEPSTSLVWKESGLRTTVTIEDIPDRVLKYSISSNVLFFWSSSAVLHVLCHERDGAGRHKPSLSCNGKIVPGSWSHVPELDPSHNEPAEFVVIGRQNFVSFRNYNVPTLAVLFVSWEDGVAYRRGLVNIKVSDWLLLENRVWKLISLG